MLSEAWIPVISVMLGGLIGLMGALLQHKFTQNVDRKRLIREKLEEIYRLSKQVEQRANQNFQDMMGVQIGLTEKKDVVSKENVNKESPIDSLLRLVNLYEPRLLNIATELEKHVEALRQNSLDFYMEILETGKVLSKKSFKEKIKPGNDIIDTCEQLRVKIAKLIRLYI